MKRNYIEARTNPDRPMTTISMRLPEDVIKDLKNVAPLMGLSGYQPLIRFFIGKGLRECLSELHASPEWERLGESLRNKGLSDEEIAAVIYESRHGFGAVGKTPAAPTVKPKVRAAKAKSRVVLQ